NCKVTTLNGKCNLCQENTFYNYEQQTCVQQNYSIDNCSLMNFDNDRCISCQMGFFEQKNIYVKCPNNCKNSYDKNNCILCETEYFLYNKMCLSNSTVTSNCKRLIQSSSMCALCENKYYRNVNKNCDNCLQGCKNCYTKDRCISCEKDHFLTTNSSACLSFDLLSNCLQKTQSGCLQCSEGYFVLDQICVLCSFKNSNCEKCNPNFFVLHVKRIIFYHQLHNNGLSCYTQIVRWVILICVIVALLILTTVIILVVILFVKIFNHLKHKNQSRHMCLFTMNKSNVQFEKSEIDGLVLNKREIRFSNNDIYENKIPIYKLTRELNVHFFQKSSHRILFIFLIKMFFEDRFLIFYKNKTNRINFKKYFPKTINIIKAKTKDTLVVTLIFLYLYVLN
ncbi:hypothetical protein EIN_510190, partial [Entamoeba invadens IP1]